MSVVDVKIERPVGVTYSNQFVVELKFMHGDGDYFETAKCAFPADKKELLIEFLNWLPYADQCGGGSDTHNYNKFADPMSYEDDCEEAGIEYEFYGLDEGWPYDSNGDCGAALRSVNIIYVDANGAEFSVSQIES